VTGTATERLLDLRRAPLAALRAVDYRSADRDFWADEAALQDRVVAVWAGLDDAAWRLPGAAQSDAGGPDWSLHDHVGHLVDWWEIATEYIGKAMRGGRWPTAKDFDGGDWDAYNERRRDRFADIAPAVLRARGDVAHERLLVVAKQLPGEMIRSDAAWGWMYFVLHGHVLDHLNVLEPWAESLRRRQVENDPFEGDPQPTRRDLAGARSRFMTDAATILPAFEVTMRSVPDEAWALPTGQPWSFGDHVAHLAGWFVEGARALETHRSVGRWREMPPEGVDAFNDRQVRGARGTSPAELRERYAAGRDRLLAAVEGMTDEEWLDPQGFSWAYEDLHGHVRAHHAMIGPWAARIGWPPARPEEEDR
jgi:hypothetical protein